MKNCDCPLLVYNRAQVMKLFVLFKHQRTNQIVLASIELQC